MIIITGSEGYIGKYLTKAVKGDVFLIDRKKDTEIKAGFYDKNKWLEPDLIYHLAAQTSVNDSFKDPIRDAKDNILATIEMLKFGKKIIFASSGTVYGNRVGASEIDRTNPQSPYAISKLAAEQYIINSGVPYVILRIGNVWGRDNNKGVIRSFKNGGKIYGDGTHTRDYIHIDDVVNALLMAQRWPDGIYNIGTGIPTSVNDIADMMEIKRRYVDAVEEQKYISLNISKAEQQGWKPENKLCKKSILS